MNPYVIGGVAIVIFLLSWQLRSALKENGALEAKLITANEATTQAADANDTNQETITTLEARIVTMVEERRVDAVERDRVMDERDQELAVARAESIKLKEEREEAFNENPDCIDLASLDVGFFCPLVGVELRQRGTHQSSN
jgi:hypothetical protein